MAPCRCALSARPAMIRVRGRPRTPPLGRRGRHCRRAGRARALRARPPGWWRRRLARDAVGELIIDLLPAPLVNFGKETLGYADKPILLIMVVLGVLACAGLAGRLELGRRFAGAAVFADGRRRSA